MSTTPSEPDHAFVWIWLPGSNEPVVAGRLDRSEEVVFFTYGQSYLAREDAISLYLPELPLGRGSIAPLAGQIAGCIADAGPDSWGQRVILHQRIGAGAVDTSEIGVFTYLLASGTDRTGALDFQTSSSRYLPRDAGEATLAELAESAELVEQGVPLSPALNQALLHGSSLGGARPKARLREGSRQLIAKFSRSTDTYPLEKGEFVAMKLAALTGLSVANVALTRAIGKDVLLVDRFDRTPDGGRRAMVSSLTILGLDEVSGRYASYADLADTIRGRFTEPVATLRELFARITFNILCSNTDDHARNHAAFWDGSELTLTPAYDVCPQLRTGGESAQLMAIGEDGYRMSQLAGCVERASTYLLSVSDAREIIDHQIITINDHWSDVCDQGQLSEVERRTFWSRQFLNPYATEGY
jgi:serine/threonine-protein kinase HipA